MVLARTASLPAVLSLSLLVSSAATVPAAGLGTRTAPLTGASQAARLVADVAPGGPVLGSKLVDLAVFGDRLYLLTNDATGLSLHVVAGDGTGVRTICRDSRFSNAVFWGAIGNTVFWHTGSQGRFGNLWRSDGTTAGSGPVLYEGRALEISAGVGDRSEQAIYDGGLVFNAWTDQRAFLFRIQPGDHEATKVGDGVESLTAALGWLFFVRHEFVRTLWAMGPNLDPFALESFASFDSPRGLTATEDHLFFIGDEPQQVWAADDRLFSIGPVTSFKSPRPFEFNDGLQPLGDRLYFAADEKPYGQELWRSDGTEEGTNRLTDFAYPYPFGGYDPVVARSGSKVVFWASDSEDSDKLWVNTGQRDSTRLLLDACPQGCGGGNPRHLFAVGNRILFSAFSSSKGLEPWTTDGTSAGTRPLGDLCRGACGSQPSFSAAAGQAAFVVGKQDSRGGIWETNGTPEGTRLIAQPEGQFPIGPVVPVAGTTYFWAGRSDVGMQLWQSSGTPESVQLVTALTTRAPGSMPRSFEVLGERIVFQGCKDGVLSLWSVRRSGGDLQQLVSLPGEACELGAARMVMTADGLSFLRRDQPSQPAQLWTTDGTSSGTHQVTSFVSPQRIGSDLVAVGGDAAFFVGDGAKLELWRSDGSSGGTTAATVIPESPQVTAVYAAVEDEFFFLTRNGQPAVPALWRSDGTASGTRIIQTGRTPLDSSPRFVRAGSWIYFLARAENGSENELWRTDGTAASTTSVRGVGWAKAGPLVVRGDEVFFLMTAVDTTLLFRSDGTAAGTEFFTLTNRSLPSGSPEASNLTLVGETLFFSTTDRDHGSELWSSDGTPGGTAVLANIAPGNRNSVPQDFVVANGRLYFTADDQVHGAELWTTDGTPAGTHMVQDLAPGPASSAPQSTKLLGSELVFSADDGINGRELWALPLAPVLPPCAPSSDHLCLAAGRYQVEAFWRDFQGHTGRGTAVSLTGDTGYFWFFDPANVEVVLKVLDGSSLNGHRWVFYGALSSVEYSLTVTDTETGAARRYVNPSGVLASVADTSAFGPGGATAAAHVLSPAETGRLPLASERRAAEAAGACEPSATRLCLNGDRFAIDIDWKDFQGQTGKGIAVSLTGDTGHFWFFDQANVEVVVKVLDGRGLNGKFWVFYGALSSVEYTLTVTDTQTGVSKVYRNPSGWLASRADTDAF